MSVRPLNIGDIVVGLRDWNKPWGEGEVIKIEEKNEIEYVVVHYKDGTFFNHFRTNSTEIKWIGKKIPVINIEDLI